MSFLLRYILVSVIALGLAACIDDAPESTPEPDMGQDVNQDVAPDLPATNWWNTEWQRRIEINLESPADEDLAGFVARLKFDIIDGTIAGETINEDGIQFVDEFGNRLPHEVENWSSGEVWVRLRGLRSGTNRLWMYFQSPNAGLNEPAQTWSDYESVLHFTDTTLDSAAPDAAFSCVSECGTAAGLVSSGFRPGAHFLEKALAEGTQAGPQEALSVSFWYAGDDGDRGPLVSAQARSCEGWEILVDDEGIHASNSVPTDASLELCPDELRTNLDSSDTILNGSFRHVLMVVDRTTNTLSLFHDGDLVAEGAIPEETSDEFDSTTLRIGANTPTDINPDLRTFSGRLDEVRVIRQALSHSWAVAHRMNLRELDEFQSFGDVETQ